MDSCVQRTNQHPEPPHLNVLGQGVKLINATVRTVVKYWLLRFGSVRFSRVVARCGSLLVLAQTCGE